MLSAIFITTTEVSRSKGVPLTFECLLESQLLFVVTAATWAIVIEALLSDHLYVPGTLLGTLLALSHFPTKQ